MTKQFIGYAIGNALNLVAMILLLPAVVHLNNQNGFFTAQGILVAQIFSIFGGYTFSLTVPRTMKDLKEKKLKQALIFELLIFQLFLGILGVGVIYLVNKNLPMQSFYGFCIAYSAVIQLQWFHIIKKNFLIQVSLLVVTRITLICIEILILNSSELSGYNSPRIFPVLTALFCCPVLPTFFYFNLKILKENFRGLNYGTLIYREIKNGRHLFFASLLSSVYNLGPSLVVANMNPTLLVFIQQFDRVRLAVSNLSGMFLSTVYPFMINISTSKLMYEFKRLQKNILIPILSINLILLFSLTSVPIDSLELLRNLQMSYISFTLALITGFFAALSNLITLTFLHPMRNDKLYLEIIFIGALIFLLSAFFSYALFPIILIGNCIMTSILLAESAISILLWSKSIALLNKVKLKAI
jgi:hypothetical protein